jgi:hypothetical protein
LTDIAGLQGWKKQIFKPQYRKSGEKMKKQYYHIIVAIVFIVILMNTTKAFSSQTPEPVSFQSFSPEVFDISSVGIVHCISISPDNRNVALGTEKGIFVYNLKHKSLKKLADGFGLDPVVKFSNTGKYLGYFSTLNYGIVDLERNILKIFHKKDLLPGETIRIFFSSDDRLFFINPTDRGMKVIEVNTGKTVYYVQNSSICNDVIFSDRLNDKDCIALFRDCFFKYDRATGKTLFKADFRSNNSKIRHSSHKLICLDKNNIIQIRKNKLKKVNIYKNKTVQHKEISGIYNMTSDFSFDKTRSRFCTSGNEIINGNVFYDFYIFVFSVKTLDLILPPIKLPDDDPFCMSPSGKFVVFVDKGKLHRIDLDKKYLRK